MVNIIGIVIIILLLAVIGLAMKLGRTRTPIEPLASPTPQRQSKRKSGGNYEDIPKQANIIYSFPNSKLNAPTDGNSYEAIEVPADSWMKRAISTAIESAKKSHGPFAAIILQIDSETQQVIRYWTNHNQVVANKDPTAHAEVEAIRSACTDLGLFELDNIQQDQSLLPQPSQSSYTVMYASCEPCPMCMAACYWARIPKLIFGATADDAATHANFADDTISRECAIPYHDRQLMQIKYSPCKHNTDPFTIYTKFKNGNIYGAISMSPSKTDS